MSADLLRNLASEWYDPLYRFACSLSSNREDALDLTQSAFLKLSRRISELREPAKAKSWLFRTVHSEFVDQYRRSRRFLSAYRPNGADASDGIFAEALQLCRNDQETARWFETETAFDRRASVVLETIPVPSADRRKLEAMLDLEVGRPPAERRRRTWWRGTLALAAAVAVVLGLFGILRTDPEVPAGFPQGGRTLTALAESAAPLDFRSTDHGEIRAWLARAGLSVPGTVEQRFSGTRRRHLPPAGRAADRGLADGLAC